MNILKKLAVPLTALGLIAGLSGAAQAIPVVEVNGVAIFDNGPGDSSAVDGWIEGTISTGDFVGGFTAWTDPFLSSALPRMHFDLRVTSGQLGGVLDILFVDDFAGPAHGSLESSISGMTDGTVALETGYFDGVLNLVNNSGPLTGNFSDAAVDLFATAADPYFLVMQMTVTHDPANVTQITSFNAELAVPEPAALGLLGFGLLGFGALRRYRKRA